MNDCSPLAGCVGVTQLESRFFSVAARSGPEDTPYLRTTRYDGVMMIHLTYRLAFRFFTLCFCLAMQSNSMAEEPMSFNRDVRAILSEKCFFCHGPDANHREAELRLDLEAEAKMNAIVAGHADQSELISRILSEDPDAVMPPPESGKTLTPDEIDILRRWIDNGAAYETHWSFSSPERPELPEVGDDRWGRNSIDRFVLARLRAEQMQPSSQADRHVLIRRLSLDLTGLPPSVDEVQAFVTDTSESAYEEAVERLLRSHRFGEHMARYWLDAARFADTNGYQYDLEREQWVWRDWVINAFNTNMPFDQFTIEQIAGDLLPNATDQQILATGFHRNHPITIEGGVIDEEYRTEYVVDRVVTTSTVWLGLTMTCGRCHDHKYDPISQRDFYRFFAFFNNAPEKGLNGFDPKIKVPSPLLENQLEVWDQQVAAARADYERIIGESGLPVKQWEEQLAGMDPAWNVIVPKQMASAGGAVLTVQDDQSVLASGPNPVNETYEIILQTDAKKVSAIQLEALVDPSTVNGGAGRGSNGNFVLSEFEVEVAEVEVAGANDPVRYRKVKLVNAEADYSQQNYNINLAIDGKVDQSGWAVDGHAKIENRSAVFTFAKPITSESGLTFKVRMLHRLGLSHQIARFRLSLHESDSPPLSMSVAAILARPKENRSPAEIKQLQEGLLQRFAPEDAKVAFAKLRDLERQRVKAKAVVPATMVMREMTSPRKTHVLFRGEYDKPGEEVHAGTPQTLPPIPEGLASNRLGLAKWLVMPNQPLTARVTVNRFWQQLFGIGIVKTVEDFGSQGEWPSHPKLLDWLAVDFVESGWDVKRLLKQIVMSSTYRQSSKLTPEKIEADPENRLLARGPRLRLDAEVIRDSALFASGLLNQQLGGPSVFPYHPAGLWQEINNRPGYSRTYQQDSGEKLFRRSLYTFWKRTVPPPSMSAFDAPGREYCQVRRSRTNTPLQALVMLHDPQFVEAARHLAERILREGGETQKQRIEYAFLLCHARQPNELEFSVLKDVVETRLAQYTGNRDAAKELLSVGDSPIDESHAVPELAAWTAASRVLLNLSEFVTKP